VYLELLAGESVQVISQHWPQFYTIFVFNLYVFSEDFCLMQISQFYFGRAEAAFHYVGNW